MKTYLKVLFVCPFAHYAGHFPWAATHETHALAQAGANVELLTFQGVAGNAEVKVPHQTVYPRIKLMRLLYHLANILRRWPIISALVMFLETYLTWSVAIKLKRELHYDIIHLRDGEPFLFLLQLLNLFNRNYAWVVSLTGANFIARPPLNSTFGDRVRLFLHTAYIKTLNSKLWQPAYRASLARNRLIFVTQNEIIKERFELYEGGVLAGRVIAIPMGIDQAPAVLPREAARKHFGLPLDKKVFLSFGFLHAGKDIETVFRALQDIPEAYLIHGGDQGLKSALPDMTNLVHKYGMQYRSVIRGHYIPEEEKPYFFFSADAVILSYTRDFQSATSMLWQACRFGTPVIASNNGQLKEVMERYRLGHVFEAQNAGSLKQAVLQFIQLRPDEIGMLQDGCRKFCDDFSVTKWAEKYLELYNSFVMEKS